MELEVIQLLIGAAPATGVLLVVLRWAIKYQVTVTEAYRNDFKETHKELVATRLEVEKIQTELHKLTVLYQSLVLWVRRQKLELPAEYDPFSIEQKVEQIHEQVDVLGEDAKRI